MYHLIVLSVDNHIVVTKLIFVLFGYLRKNIKMAEKSSLSNILADIIEGKEPQDKSEHFSSDENISEEEGVINIEKEEKQKKKLKKRKEKEDENLDDGDNQDSKLNTNKINASARKRQWEMIARTFPNNNLKSEVTKEKFLKRTARKGVVQLFNAVREHQKSLKRRQKGGNIQQRTTRVEETEEKFNHLLDKRRKGEEEEERIETESKWKALQGREAGEEEDWM